MGVHRITDRAELALRNIAEREGRKPADVLSRLIVEYELGLSFNEPSLVNNPESVRHGWPRPKD